MARLVWLVVLALAIVSVTACDDGGLVTTGVVIDVQQTDPATVTGFTLRADDGRTIIFGVGQTSSSDGSFPSIHLRDHLVSAQRVAVRYVEGDDGPVAIRLADAP
ncbi:MAG: hypothetical protein ACHQ02_04525 [Candidatus Limnocylindrales bacterium]